MLARGGIVYRGSVQTMIQPKESHAANSDGRGYATLRNYRD
jgi:hypothetical protein